MITHEMLQAELIKIRNAYKQITGFQRFWFWLTSNSLANALSKLDLAKPQTQIQLVKAYRGAWFYQSAFGVLSQFSKSYLYQLVTSAKNKTNKAQLQALNALASKKKDKIAKKNSLGTRRPEPDTRRPEHGEGSPATSTVQFSRRSLATLGTTVRHEQDAPIPTSAASLPLGSADHSVVEPRRRQPQAIVEETIPLQDVAFLAFKGAIEQIVGDTLSPRYCTSLQDFYNLHTEAKRQAFLALLHTISKTGKVYLFTLENLLTHPMPLLHIDAFGTEQVPVAYLTSLHHMTLVHDFFIQRPSKARLTALIQMEQKNLEKLLTLKLPLAALDDEVFLALLNNDKQQAFLELAAGIASKDMPRLIALSQTGSEDKLKLLSQLKDKLPNERCLLRLFSDPAFNQLIRLFLAHPDNVTLTPKLLEKLTASQWIYTLTERLEALLTRNPRQKLLPYLELADDDLSLLSQLIERNCLSDDDLATCDLDVDKRIALIHWLSQTTTLNQDIRNIAMICKEPASLHALIKTLEERLLLLNDDLKTTMERLYQRRDLDSMVWLIQCFHETLFATNDETARDALNTLLKQPSCLMYSSIFIALQNAGLTNQDKTRAHALFQEVMALDNEAIHKLSALLWLTQLPREQFVKLKRFELAFLIQLDDLNGESFIKQLFEHPGFAKVWETLTLTSDQDVLTPALSAALIRFGEATRAHFNNMLTNTETAPQLIALLSFFQDSPAIQTLPCDQYCSFLTDLINHPHCIELAKRIRGILNNDPNTPFVLLDRLVHVEATSDAEQTQLGSTLDSLITQRFSAKNMLVFFENRKRLIDLNLARYLDENETTGEEEQTQLLQELLTPQQQVKPTSSNRTSWFGRLLHRQNHETGSAPQYK